MRLYDERGAVITANECDCDERKSVGITDWASRSDGWDVFLCLECGVRWYEQAIPIEYLIDDA